VSDDITVLLRKVSAGDLDAEAELMTQVYGELKRLANKFLRRERKGHTLQATALVHEAFIKLAGNNKFEFSDRAHFYAVAAKIMRRLLVDYARKHGSQRRGGGNLVPLHDEPYLPCNGNFITDLDVALERLAETEPRQAKVVELRYFGGMSEDEVAAYLNISARTVKRDWLLARTTLYDELYEGPGKS